MSRPGPRWIQFLIVVSPLSFSRMTRRHTFSRQAGSRKLQTAPASWFVISNVSKAGSYQVRASAEAWIDVIQEGKSLASTAHSGRRDCPDVRKTVRFDLQTGAVTIQVSGVDSKLIKLAIPPAE
jgi:hypothetical protein